MKQRVLVIDDNPDIRMILEVRLHRAGFEVSTVANGVGGLRAVASLHPDLVLVDLFMPEQDGFTFLEELNRQPDAPPAYAMTGQDDDDEVDRERLRRLGAAGLISKTTALGRDFPLLLLHAKGADSAQASTLAA